MEGILKRQREGLVCSLESKNDGSDDRSEGGEGGRDGSGAVEEAGSNNVGFEVFLYSSLLHVPADDLNILFGFVSDLDEVQSVVGPVAALSDGGAVEIVLRVVVVAEVVGRVDKAFHDLNKNKYKFDAIS